MTNLFRSGGQESIGIEMPQIMLAVQIKNNIEAALELQAQTWDRIDVDVAAALGQPNRVCKLEVPPSGCIYSGSRLGVLGMPWDRFPAVATMVDKASPTAESARFDQSTDVYAPQLYIEAVLRSDAYRDGDPEERIIQEGIVDRRAKRTLEALVHCVSIDPSLGGNVLPLTAPTVSQTDPFPLAGSEAGEQTLRRVFSLVRAQYSLVSYATLLDASQPAPSVLAASLLGG